MNEDDIDPALVRKPEWFFKPVNISPERLSAIQAEFRYIFKTYYEENIFNIGGNVHVNFIDKKHIEEFAPTFIKMLKDLGIYDRWFVTSFSATRGKDNISTVHADSVKGWKGFCHALNLPVQNCHDSYTVWYDVGNNPGWDALPWGYVDGWGWDDNEIVAETARVPVSQPAWVNIVDPHRAETYHDETRVIITSRFYPSLFDYLNDPSKEPILININ